MSLFAACHKKQVVTEDCSVSATPRTQDHQDINSNVNNERTLCTQKDDIGRHSIELSTMPHVTNILFSCLFVGAKGKPMLSFSERIVLNRQFTTVCSTSFETDQVALTSNSIKLETTDTTFQQVAHHTSDVNQSFNQPLPPSVTTSLTSERQSSIGYPLSECRLTDCKVEDSGSNNTTVNMFCDGSGDIQSKKNFVEYLVDDDLQFVEDYILRNTNSDSTIELTATCHDTPTSKPQQNKVALVVSAQPSESSDIKLVTECQSPQELSTPDTIKNEVDDDNIDKLEDNEILNFTNSFPSHVNCNVVVSSDVEDTSCDFTSLTLNVAQVGRQEVSVTEVSASADNTITRPSQLEYQYGSYCVIADEKDLRTSSKTENTVATCIQAGTVSKTTFDNASGNMPGGFTLTTDLAKYLNYSPLPSIMSDRLYFCDIYYDIIHKVLCWAVRKVMNKYLVLLTYCRKTGEIPSKKNFTGLNKLLSGYADQLFVEYPSTLDRSKPSIDSASSATEVLNQYNAISNVTDGYQADIMVCTIGTVVDRYLNKQHNT